MNTWFFHGNEKKAVQGPNVCTYIYNSLVIITSKATKQP